jgi:hypothetical protein
MKNTPGKKSDLSSIVESSRVKDSMLSQSELKGRIEEAVLLDDPKLLHQLNLSRK